MNEEEYMALYEKIPKKEVKYYYISTMRTPKELYVNIRQAIMTKEDFMALYESYKALYETMTKEEYYYYETMTKEENMALYESHKKEQNND